MSDEHDSWLKSAFDFDVGGALSAIEEKATGAAKQASGAVADVADGARAIASGAGSAVKDYAASKYARMKEDAKVVAEGEHWLTEQIDKAQDTAAAKVRGLADKARGIPVVEQVADAGAKTFDQATQLNAGALEGVVGMGGALLQVVANPVDAAKGLYTMAEHVPLPVAGAPNPLKAAHGVLDVVAGDATLADTTAKLFDPVEQQNDDAAFWKTVGGGLVDQYRKTVGEDGDYAKGIGRAAVDIGSMFLGVGEAGAAAKASEVARLAEMAKLAEAAKLADAAKLAEAAEAARLAEAAKVAEAAEAAKAAKAAETAKAADASKAADGAKATGKAAKPKAGSVTAANINRVPGMQKFLDRLSESRLPLNDLGLTPDDVIAMANRDPAAAIAELDKRLEIAKVRAEEVEAHAISREDKIDAAYAEAEAERRFYREELLGKTPGKDSPVGRQVIERMRGEGKIRGVPPAQEVFHAPTQQWYPLAECEMGHTIDAVTWWKKEGMYHGEKSDFVRDWMKDPRNYELEPGAINRSRGAQLTDRYVPAHPDPITADELAGKVKDRTATPDD